MSEAEGNLDALVGRVSRGDARVLVEKAGVPGAGLVSAEDLERLDRLDREGAKRSRVIDEARAAFGDVSPDVPDRRVLRHAQRLKGDGTTVVPPTSASNSASSAAPPPPHLRPPPLITTRTQIARATIQRRRGR